LEDKKVEIQNKFADNTLSGEEITAFSIQIKEISDEIDTKTERWFELSLSE